MRFTFGSDLALENPRYPSSAPKGALLALMLGCSDDATAQLSRRKCGRLRKAFFDNKMSTTIIIRLPEPSLERPLNDHLQSLEKRHAVLSNQFLLSDWEPAFTIYFTKTRASKPKQNTLMNKGCVGKFKRMGESN